MTTRWPWSAALNAPSSPMSAAAAASPSSVLEGGGVPPRNWPLVLARAVLSLLLGAYALAWPLAALAAIVMLTAVFMLLHGVFAIASGIRAARHHRRSAGLLFEGTVGIVAGIAAAAWPGITLLVLVLLAAGWALLSGGAMIATAVRHGARRGRAWLVVGGALSIAWAVVLVVAPVAAALAMTLWLGVYALVFGVALAVLAFHLRHDAVAAAPPGAPAAGAG